MLYRKTKDGGSRRSVIKADQRKLCREGNSSGERNGKIFVLSVTDHEEYILSRIMEIIAAEPGFDHIAISRKENDGT